MIVKDFGSQWTDFAKITKIIYLICSSEHFMFYILAKLISLKNNSTNDIIYHYYDKTFHKGNWKRKGYKLFPELDMVDYGWLILTPTKMECYS